MRCWILIVLSLVACVATVAAQDSDPEFALVRRAVEDELAATPRDSVLLSDHLRAQTDRTGDFQSWLERLIPERFRRGIPVELLRRYWQVNKSPRELRVNHAIAGRPVRLVRQHVPADTQGVFSASRVAFSPSGDSAIVALTFSCPGLCGSSELWLYVRASSGWERRRLLHSLDH